MSDVESFDWLSLSEGETVLWSGHPRLMTVAKLAVVVLAVVAGAAWVEVLYALVAAVLGVALLGWTYLWLVNTDYVLTNRAVYRRRGVLGEGIRRVPLSKVQNTSLSKGILGTRFGFGTVAVDTAGSDGIEVSVNDVYDAEELQELLVEYTKHSAGVGMNAAGVGGSYDPESVERVLAEARELRSVAESLERTFGGSGR